MTEKEIRKLLEAVRQRKMVATIAFSLLVLCAGAQWASGVAALPSPEEVEREEYAVWSAAINNLFAQDQDRLFVILANPTFDDIHEGHLRSLLSGLLAARPAEVGTDELLIDFFFRNRETFWELKERFAVKSKYVLVNKSELENLVRNDDVWKRFFKKYPGAKGLLVLSRVGFNDRLDQALVYCKFRTRGLVEPWLVVLKKGEAGWEVQYKGKFLPTF